MYANLNLEFLSKGGPANLDIVVGCWVQVGFQTGKSEMNEEGSMSMSIPLASQFSILVLST